MRGYLEKDVPQKSSFRRKVVVVVILVIVVTVAVLFIKSCREDIPSDSVAKVGNTSISKKTLKHWVGVTYRNTQVGESGARGSLPKKGTPEYNQLSAETMSFLIRSIWMDQEADKKGVSVSQEDLDKKLRKTQKEFFSQPGSFKEFLKKNSMTKEDVEMRLKLEMNTSRVSDYVTKDIDISKEDIEKYYQKNRGDYGALNKTNVRKIKKIIDNKQRNKLLKKFLKEYEKKGKSRTKCRKDYIVAECENAPDPVDEAAA